MSVLFMVIEATFIEMITVFEEDNHYTTVKVTITASHNFMFNTLYSLVSA